MKQRHKLIALELEDGTTPIMQLYADVIIEAEIRRAALPSPVVSWREITDAEAAEIRRNRPKPLPTVSSDVAPDATADELRRQVQTLAQHLLVMSDRLDAIDKIEIVKDIKESP